MKKKFLIPIILSALTVSLTACGSNVSEKEVSFDVSVEDASSSSISSSSENSDTSKNTTKDKTSKSDSSTSKKSKDTDTKETSSSSSEKASDKKSSSKSDTAKQTDSNKSSSSGNSSADKKSSSGNSSDTGGSANKNQTSSKRKNTSSSDTTKSSESTLKKTNSSGISGSSSSGSTSSHTHNWVAQTKIVHHDAEYTTQWVQDSAAYDEPVYEEQPVYESVDKCVCNYCGAVFNRIEEYIAHDQAAIDAGDLNHGGYHVIWEDVQTGTQQVQTGTVHHDEVGHYEQQVVSAAYDETVTTGYKCSSCGATK